MQSDHHSNSFPPEDIASSIAEHLKHFTDTKQHREETEHLLRKIRFAASAANEEMKASQLSNFLRQPGDRID